MAVKRTRTRDDDVHDAGRTWLRTYTDNPISSYGLNAQNQNAIKQRFVGGVGAFTAIALLDLLIHDNLVKTVTSDKDIADVLGVDRSTISRWRACKAFPSHGHIEYLMRTFKVDNSRIIVPSLQDMQRMSFIDTMAFVKTKWIKRPVAQAGVTTEWLKSIRQVVKLLRNRAGTGQIDDEDQIVDEVEKHVPGLRTMQRSHVHHMLAAWLNPYVLTSFVVNDHTWLDSL